MSHFFFILLSENIATNIFIIQNGSLKKLKAQKVRLEKKNMKMMLQMKAQKVILKTIIIVFNVFQKQKRIEG